MPKESIHSHLVTPRSRFPTIALAAKPLQCFAKQHEGHPCRANSLRELRSAGRHDLMTSYRKFGQARLLEAACLKASVNRGQSIHLLPFSLSPLSRLLPLHAPAPHPLPHPSRSPANPKTWGSQSRINACKQTLPASHTGKHYICTLIVVDSSSFLCPLSLCVLFVL